MAGRYYYVLVFVEKWVRQSIKWKVQRNGVLVRKGKGTECRVVVIKKRLDAVTG